MEAADYRQEQTGTPTLSIGFWLPQWSPPLSAGAVRYQRRRGGGGVRAAMEPAGYQREHVPGTLPTAYYGTLQWSLPVIGGSTRQNQG